MDKIVKHSTSGHPYWEITADGKPWIFKPAKHGFLADQEHAATMLAREFGYDAPCSRLMTVDSQYGQAQERIDNVGDLEYGQSLGFYDPAPIPWSDLSGNQLVDIARDHVLRWVLADDDGRASNYLRTIEPGIVGSERIVGIDYGRMLAPGYERWQGLAADSRADARSALVSTGLYDAIRAGLIPRDVTDRVRRSVQDRADDIQATPDATVRAILAPAFANRPGADGEALTEAILARKRTLSRDVRDMWTRVYEQAGW
jgi:hypothetical protein